MKYRIKNWSQLFENNRTRDLKRMDWVPIPNRMDDESYIELVDHPDGAAHLGAWLAIVEIASRQHERGSIPHGPAGIPHSLARISRLPATLFEAVLPRLLQLQWIERVTEIPQDDAEIPHPTAEIPQYDAPRARSGREWNGREGKGKNLSPDSVEPKPDFVSEVAAWIHARHPKPRRDIGVGGVAKKLQAILRHKKIPKAEQRGYLTALDQQHQRKCDSIDWQKNGGEYAKGLTNYLAPTEGRYEPQADEAEPEETQPRKPIYNGGRISAEEDEAYRQAWLLAREKNRRA